MLIPILVLLGVGSIVGSYAFFPSSWRKAKHRLTRDKRRREGILYLTFDDGPSAEDTPALLDLLARFQVPATFFVVGEFARDNPQLIHRMREEGHQVAFATTVPISCPPGRPDRTLPTGWRNWQTWALRIPASAPPGEW